MARCKYCGRPTERQSDQHAECHDRHQRALSMIPEFFQKLLESAIPPERFAALLMDAAEASFINANELSELCINGIAELIDSVLETRLLTVGESSRIAAIMATLDPLFAAAPRLEDAMTQIDILRALGDGMVPDRVQVEGPMPITLRRGETVLWIFNGTKAFRCRPEEAASPQQIHVPIANDVYFGLYVFEREIPLDKRVKTGDLVLTNYNIYFLSGADRVARTAIARVTGLEPYANGVAVHTNQGAMTYILADSWFLTNAIARLTQFIRRGARDAKSKLTSIDAE